MKTQLVDGRWAKVLAKTLGVASAGAVLAGCLPNPAEVTLSVDESDITAGQQVTFDYSAQSTFTEALGDLDNVKRTLILSSDDAAFVPLELRVPFCGIGFGTTDWACIAQQINGQVAIHPVRSATYTLTYEEEALALSLLATKQGNGSASVTVTVEQDVLLSEVVTEDAMPDAVLRGCIEASYDIYNTLTSEVTSLSCATDKGLPLLQRIRDLSGIGFLYQLQSLDISGNGMNIRSGMAPVAYLDQLQSIDVSDNLLSNCTPYVEFAAGLPATVAVTASVDGVDCLE